MKKTEQLSKDHRQFNLCCYEIKEGLIEFYLNVKLRNESSIYDITSEKLEKEKEQMRDLDSLEILEQIKTSVEALVALKSEDEAASDISKINETLRKKTKKLLASNTLSEVSKLA